MSLKVKKKVLEKYFFKVVRTTDGRTNIVEQILYNKGRWIKH